MPIKKGTIIRHECGCVAKLLGTRTDFAGDANYWMDFVVLCGCNKDYVHYTNDTYSEERDYFEKWYSWGTYKVLEGNKEYLELLYAND